MALCVIRYELRAQVFKLLRSPNRFQGINSASLCCLACRYDITHFLLGSYSHFFSVPHTLSKNSITVRNRLSLRIVLSRTFIISDNSSVSPSSLQLCFCNRLQLAYFQTSINHLETQSSGFCGFRMVEGFFTSLINFAFNLLLILQYFN
jgi:hypothetical protein